MGSELEVLRTLAELGRARILEALHSREPVAAQYRQDHGLDGIVVLEEEYEERTWWVLDRGICSSYRYGQRARAIIAPNGLEAAREFGVCMEDDDDIHVLVFPHTTGQARLAGLLPGPPEAFTVSEEPNYDYRVWRSRHDLMRDP
jgi:hypothetical protein